MQCLAAAALLAWTTTAVAQPQPYPSKPIRVINPAAPGGNSDIVFRVIAPKMGEIVGQQFVLDYRAGAGGVIGADMTAKSPPDGYTTAIVAASFFFNPALIKNLPYDTIKDFTPLGLVVDIPAAVVLHPSLPVKNIKELIALARVRPGQIFFSNAGPGTVGHLLLAGHRQQIDPARFHELQVVDRCDGPPGGNGTTMRNVLPAIWAAVEADYAISTSTARPELRRTMATPMESSRRSNMLSRMRCGVISPV